MGKFIYDEAIANDRIKRVQQVTVPITIGFGGMDAIAEAVEAWPDSYEAEVTKVVAASELADIEIRYTARGANKTDVIRRLDKTGVRYIDAKTKTKALEE